MYDHAYFARPDAFIEEAAAGWYETFEQIRSKDLIAEIKEAERDVAENPSDETWRRLLALKQQKNDETMDEQV